MKKMHIQIDEKIQLKHKQFVVRGMPVGKYNKKNTIEKGKMGN